jgi:tetratricopeptide (TPR) repeat protein
VRPLVSFLALSISLITPTFADELLASALAAEARFDSQTALQLFRQLEQTRPDDPVILQKIARQLSDSVEDTPDRERRKALAAEARRYAERAVQLDPQNPVNVLSLAICHGKVATYASTREKIALSRLVKAETERALELDPSYDWAHHILGRWHYEVASLSSTQRWLVKLIYGGLPEASHANAIASLRRAVELAPDIASHHIALGFAYLAAQQKADARAAFEKGLALPSREKPDEASKQRARTALATLPHNDASH